MLKSRKIQSSRQTIEVCTGIYVGTLNLTQNSACPISIITIIQCTQYRCLLYRKICVHILNFFNVKYLCMEKCSVHTWMQDPDLKGLYSEMEGTKKWVQSIGLPLSIRQRSLNFYLLKGQCTIYSSSHLNNICLARETSTFQVQSFCSQSTWENANCFHTIRNFCQTDHFPSAETRNNPQINGKFVSLEKYAGLSNWKDYF